MVSGAGLLMLLVGDVVTVVAVGVGVLTSKDVEEAMAGEAVSDRLMLVGSNELRLVMGDGLSKGKGEAGLLRNTIAEVLYTHAK